MRIKNILSIAAFSTAFISSTAFAGLFIDRSEIRLIEPVRSGYNTEPTSCFKNRSKAGAAEQITAVLERDDRNGGVMDEELLPFNGEIHNLTAKSSFFNLYADAKGEYVDQSSGIEDARLPLDFQAAWREHMKAWRDYADFLENTKSTEIQMSDETFRTMRGKYNTNIILTWHRVLRVAEKYGSDFKPRY